MYSSPSRREHWCGVAPHAGAGQKKLEQQTIGVQSSMNEAAKTVCSAFNFDASNYLVRCSKL